MQTYFFKAIGSLEEDGRDRAGYEATNRALPAAMVNARQLLAAANASAQISALGFDRNGSWEALGPTVPTVPGPVTYTGKATTDSGRITSLALSPGCSASSCTLLAGAAGGGVWKSTNPLAHPATWQSVSNGLATNSIGSLLYDPTDSSGSTVYVGTGEPNGSSDSEAGLGLYKSTDGGAHWSQVTGSFAVAHDRAIAAIAVDPVNASHIWIGTAVARHGMSSTYGGRFTPPDAPVIGLYESHDGGAHFSLAFSVPSDPVVGDSTNGTDFFRGGVSKIQVYRRPNAPSNSPTQVYFSIFDYGLYRSTASNGYEQVFASAGGGDVATSPDSRTEFALAPMGNNLRIYLGDVGAAPADFYRTDNANVGAGALITGGSNGGWMKLSSDRPGSMGFSSYGFCEGQCSYDMFVGSPPGQPDVVWIGGSMNYGEIFTSTPPSNGRAVMRSANAGALFRDMTNDTSTPVPLGMHPDQHAIVFIPDAPGIAIIGSDGGIVRTSGDFTNASADCANRGISGVELADCQMWLTAIPTKIFSLNVGLSTLQFQGLAVNAKDPRNDVIGGTQDNGTWSYNGKTGKWFESVGGDGGPPAISPVTTFRMHSYTGAAIDVNFTDTRTFGWNWVSDPLFIGGETAGFYAPLFADPTTAGTWMVGMQHVWRTTDNGGNAKWLTQHCNEYFGDFTQICGDWQPLGGPAGSDVAGDLVGAAYGADKYGSWVADIARGTDAKAPLWVGTRRGRLFVSSNAQAANPANVKFNRIDTAAQPERFMSGIAVDSANPLHAYVSFSGYDAYTPTTPGHVFEVYYNPQSGTAQWHDLSAGLGDQPITGIAYDGGTKRLYVATDFGVLVRDHGSWLNLADGLPSTAIYQLVLDPGTHLLYAASHGRGAYRIDTSN
jgi:hypothetical protein